MSKTNVYLAFTDRATTPNSVHRTGSRPEMSQYAYRNSDTSGQEDMNTRFNALDSKLVQSALADHGMHIVDLAGCGSNHETHITTLFSRSGEK